MISPARGWQSLPLGELWAFRHVLPALVRRTVSRRHRQTLLGPAWFVLAPLMRMAGFSLLLGLVVGLPSEGTPYPLFAYAALLPWEYFAACAGRSTLSLVSHLDIISKVYFPRLLLPLSEAVAALLEFSLSFAILLLLMAYYGYGLTPRFLLLPILVLWAAGLGLGIGLLFASLQVRYRDMSNLVVWLVRGWFFVTPVVYASDVATSRLPGWAVRLYALNPMTPVVEGFRWALLGAGPGPGWTLAMAGLVIVALLIVGALLFQRAEHSVVDLV